MNLKTLAFVAAAGVLAFAPAQVFAWGGGHGGGAGESTGTYNGTYNSETGEDSGTFTDGNGSHGVSGTCTSNCGTYEEQPSGAAAEPASMLLVGAGLLGAARFLRRR